ncbi:MAG TPA: YciI family protein [Methylomirabilota bacterium]|nr:YciI family protein [Methylomirabilota bacterium]
MRFMMIVKANKDSEAGKLPPDEMIAAMGKYNEELMKAGVLVELGGLQSSAKGARVRFSSGKTIVIDGPFAETRELIAGYWVINVKSREEAIAWARRVPPPHGPDQECELEIRQFFELEDFVPSEAVDHHKELGKKLAAGKQ